MTNDMIFTHVPLCLHCTTFEVEAPFTYADGTGFCSAGCEGEANAEFAAHFDAAEELEKERYDALLARQFDDEDQLEDAA